MEDWGARQTVLKPLSSFSTWLSDRVHLKSFLHSFLKKMCVPVTTLFSLPIQLSTWVWFFINQVTKNCKNSLFNYQLEFDFSSTKSQKIAKTITACTESTYFSLQSFSKILISCHNPFKFPCESSVFSTEDLFSLSQSTTADVIKAHSHCHFSNDP